MQNLGTHIDSLKVRLEALEISHEPINHFSHLLLRERYIRYIPGIRDKRGRGSKRDPWLQREVPTNDVRGRIGYMQVREAARRDLKVASRVPPTTQTRCRRIVGKKARTVDI